MAWCLDQLGQLGKGKVALGIRVDLASCRENGEGRQGVPTPTVRTQTFHLSVPVRRLVPAQNHIASAKRDGQGHFLPFCGEVVNAAEGDVDSCIDQSQRSHGLGSVKRAWVE